MNPAYAMNWYRFEQVVEILGLSPRTVRSRLAGVPANCLRLDTDSAGQPGRPAQLIHFEALPQLAAFHALHAPSSEPSLPSLPSVQSSLPLPASRLPLPSAAPSADDLAIAELRLQAVREYLAVSDQIGREAAARIVSDKWRRHPQTRSVVVVERLRQHERKTTKTVCVGAFSVSTLRNWAALSERAADSSSPLLSLSPSLKGRVGRKRAQIPDESVDFVLALSASTARADVAKAVEKARPHMPPELQAISLRTWQRRLLERDPRKATKDIMHSISRYRARHTPDVELDWAELPFNGRWELDDVEQDWYALSTDLQRAIRPHGYAIMRTRTRQWVAFAATETDITQAQVRELLGFALANQAGGIPDQIKFERGTVACTPDLRSLLETLGVKVSQTSMDGGSAVTGLLPDRAAGHFQGKAVIESNFKRLHNLQWDQPGQVGPDERQSAPARTEALKALAVRMAAEGKPCILPEPAEWYSDFLRVMDLHNSRPHSGLPRIIDPSNGKPRHMTPNELAVSLGDQPIRLMDVRLLPRFVARAERVPVTRNGCTLNGQSYGRFDEPLQTFREVTLFASRDYPAVAYCQELGRCLAAYVKEKLSDPGDQFHAKRHLEASFRNAHEGLMAHAIASAQPGIFDMLMAASNPTPDRQVSATVCPPELLADAQGLEAGIAQHRAHQAASDRRFLPGDGERSESSSSPRHGLLARAADLAAEVEALSDSVGASGSSPSSSPEAP